MRRSISRKSSWNSSLLRTTLLAGLALWIGIQLPLLTIFYFFRSAQETRALAEQRLGIESILVDSLQQGSRFGDVVNSRGQALRLGSPLGLEDIGICRDGSDILARISDDRCHSNGHPQSSRSITLAGEPVEVIFYWKEHSPSIVETLGAASIVSSAISLLIVFVVAGATYAAMSRKVRSLADDLSKISEDSDEIHVAEDEPEFLKLREAILRMRERISQAHRLNQELGKRAAVADLAKQVSHDIRSPLSALAMVINTLKELPESQRLIVRNATQRINDIANGLLQQSKAGAHVSSNDIEPVMLVALLDSIISEKRIQFRERMEVEIQADLVQGYGLFANIDSVELARVVSNLVNNSVEAIKSQGRVTVSIRGYKNQVAIIVSDNGCGIPPEVLTQIGDPGVSHGKEGTSSGNGLGVFHARKTIEQAGGKISIQSQLGHGTIVTITLPRAAVPEWFVERIDLSSGGTVLTVDDDQSIHQVWQERFASADRSEAKIQHLAFSSLEQLESWIGETKNGEALYLIDYEFLGHSDNGLDLIARSGIGSNSILVTSRFDEPHVKARAARLGTRLLPKSLVSLVPLSG